MTTKQILITTIIFIPQTLGMALADNGTPSLVSTGVALGQTSATSSSHLFSSSTSPCVAATKITKTSVPYTAFKKPSLSVSSISMSVATSSASSTKVVQVFKKPKTKTVTASPLALPCTSGGSASTGPNTIPVSGVLSMPATGGFYITAPLGGGSSNPSNGNGGFIAGGGSGNAGVGSSTGTASSSQTSSQPTASTTTSGAAVSTSTSGTGGSGSGGVSTSSVSTSSVITSTTSQTNTATSTSGGASNASTTVSTSTSSSGGSDNRDDCEDIIDNHRRPSHQNSPEDKDRPKNKSSKNNNSESSEGESCDEASYEDQHSDEYGDKSFGHVTESEEGKANGDDSKTLSTETKGSSKNKNN